MCDLASCILPSEDGALELAETGGAEYIVVGVEFVANGLKSAPTGPLEELVEADATFYKKDKTITVSYYYSFI